MSEPIDPRSIKIKGEFTPDPSFCNFLIDRPVLEDWSLSFESAVQGKDSPLLNELFSVPGVQRVKVAGSRISIQKNVPEDWPVLARQIVPAIRRGLTAGRPAISPAVVESIHACDPEELAALIRELFETRINPGLASHGGWVKLDRIEDRDVYIQMGGGCQGCSSARLTLRNGIETAIREAAPQVRQVIDATDHAAGENPYYA